MPKPTPKTKGAATAAAGDFYEVQGRKFRKPKGYTIARATQCLFDTKGFEVVPGEVVLFPNDRVAKLVEAGWGKVVDEPLLDCTARELIALDGGETPVMG